MFLAVVLLGAFLGSASSADGEANGVLEAREAGIIETCKNIQVMQNLDLGRLKGKWFEWSSYGSVMMVPDHRCQVGFWYPGSDGKTLNALNDLVTSADEPDGTLKHRRNTWKIRDEDPKPDGNLIAEVDTLSFGRQDLLAHVLATDYDTFLLIHMCKKIATFDYAAGFVLARHKSYSSEDIKAMDDKIEAALKPNHISRTKFVPAVQSQCEKVEFAFSYEEASAGGSTSAKP